MASNDFQILAKVKADTSGIQAQLNSVKYTVSVDTSNLTRAGKRIESLNSKISQLNTATTNSQKGLQGIAKSIENVGNQSKNTSKSIDTFNRAQKKAGETAGEFGTKIKGSHKSLKELGQNFIETTGKVAKFGLSTALIGAFTNAMSEAKEAVVDFDRELTEYKKVSDLSDEELQDYTKHLGELGTEVARTRKHFSASVYSNMHKESI